MSGSSKTYRIMGLKINHIETLNKLYGSISDEHTGLKEQWKKLPGMPLRMSEALTSFLKPGEILEKSVLKPAKKIKAFVQKVSLS